MPRIAIIRNGFRMTKMTHMYSRCQFSWPLTYPTSIDSRANHISGDTRCTHEPIRRIYAGSKTEWCVSNINSIVVARYESVGMKRTDSGSLSAGPRQISDQTTLIDYSTRHMTPFHQEYSSPLFSFPFISHITHLPANG